MKQFFLYKFVVILSLLSLTTTTHATILKVNTIADGPAGSLRAQIIAASTGDTILIDISGTTILTSNLNIGKTLTIVGPSAKHFTINANGNQFNFSSATVTTISIHGVRFINSVSSVPFFKVELSATGLLTNCTFENINSSTSGGAINMLNSAQLNVYNCSFFNCTSSGNGGAISVSSGNQLVVYNSTFFSNTASGSGGAIAAAGGTTVLVNNTFLNNTAATAHAVFATAGSGVLLQNNLFTDISVPKCNSACASGGPPNWSTNGGNVFSAIAPYGFIAFSASDYFNITNAAIALRPSAVLDGYGLKYYPLQDVSFVIDRGTTTGGLISLIDGRRAPRIIYGVTSLMPDAGACEYTPYTITALTGANSFSNKLSLLTATVNPGPLYMDFDIATPGTTNLAGTFNLTHAGVYIDGYTQPGSQVYGPGTSPLTVTPFILPNSISGPGGGNSIIISGNDVQIDGLRFMNALSGVNGTASSGLQIYGCEFTNITNFPLYTSGTDNVKIGSGRHYQRNLISGNAGYGILLSNGDSVTIQGNFIGCDVNGFSVSPNNVGIQLNDIDVGLIGGNSFIGEGNIIGGNNLNGIELTDVSNIEVHGNYIGLDYKGLTSLPNLANGILITSPSTGGTINIGGNSKNRRNFICNSDAVMGFSGAGIKLDNHTMGPTNIYNNSIGLNTAGTASPNGTGVSVINSSGVSMGDGSWNKKNIVSGNNGIGIYIDGASSVSNSFNKNYIGIREGNVAAPNGNIGIHIVNGAANNTVINHVIANSGNGLADGVSLNGAGNGNNINGNFIGTDSSGTTSMPNDNGISVFGGGTGTVLGINIIAGNQNHGIYFNGFTGDALVRRNKIGLSFLGTPLANMFSGVFIENSINVHVGTTNIADTNTIAQNGSFGVHADPNSTNIGILGNSIWQNGNLGISLQSGVPLLNDANDADPTGSNGNAGQNYPDNVIASTSGGTTIVAGSMQVGPGPYNLIIQFFSVPIPMIDGSGHGEGRKFIGSTTISGAGPGAVTFSAPTSVLLPVGSVISTTATKDAGGGIFMTSEFSDTAKVRSGVDATIIDSADVTCNGAGDGMAEVGVTSGIGPFTYAWFTTTFVPTGITTAVATTLGPGSYVAIVNDLGCGCSDTSDIVTISQPLALAGAVSAVTNVSCSGTCDGSITLIESGGTPGYQYSIDNGVSYLSSNVFTGLCAGAYQFAVMDTNGCVSPLAGNIVNITSPAVLTATPVVTNESCAGANDGSITFTIVGGTPTYQVSGDGGSTFTSGSSLTNLTPGLINYQVQDTNGCIVSGSVTVTGGVVVTANFTFTPACENVLSAINDASSVSSGTITGWSWTFTGGSPSSSILQNNSVQFFTAGSPSVTLVVTTSSGCVDSITMGVTINDNPVPDAGLDTNICIGGPFTQNAFVAGGTAPFSISWSPAGDFILSTVEDAVLTAAAMSTTGSTTYTMSVSDANGCVASDLMVVTVNSIPTVSAGVDQTICNGSSVTLSATGSVASYTWDNSVVNGTAFNPTSTLTYTVTATNVAGCQNTDMVVVNVDLPYTVNAGFDFTACSTASTISLSGASSSPGVTWSTNGSGSFIPSFTTLNPTYVLAGTDTSLGTIFFILTTASSGVCATQDDTVFVTFTPGADPSFSYTDNTLCENDPAIYPATSITPGGTYGFVGSGLSLNGATGAITPSTSTPGIYQVYHILTSPCFATDTIAIEILAKPVVLITPQHLGCYGDTLQFVGNPAGGTYSGIPLGLNATSGIWINWLSGPGFHTVTYTFTHPITGCTNLDTNKIFILPAPVTTITGVLGPYCPSDGPFVVTGNPSGGALFLNSVFQGISTFSYDPNVVQTDTIIYVYQDPVTSCYGYAKVNIVVSPNPSTPILTTSAPYLFCGTSPTTLTVSNPSSTVSWYADAALTQLITTGVSISSALLPGGTNTVYIVNEVGASCASASLAFTYTHFDETLITFGGPYTTCPSTPITINMSIPSTAGISFQWVADSSINDVFALNPIVTPPQTTTYYVYANPSALPGCIIQDSITVTVLPCSLDNVTNAFSPDGDNVNDTWIINGIQLHPENSVIVFNRWGDKLIQIDDYDNVTRVWDGKYKGSLVAAGTYYFIIQYYDDGQQKAGWIQINY